MEAYECTRRVIGESSIDVSSWFISILVTVKVRSLANWPVTPELRSQSSIATQFPQKYQLLIVRGSMP